MALYHLYMANKNYSSWSVRPYFAMKVFGIPFEETVIPLALPDTRENILKISPTAKMPALVRDGETIWESLAILEALADWEPERGMWPADPAAKRLARAVSNEMHAGFMAIRRTMPMNLRKRLATPAMSDDLVAEIERMTQLWLDCRARFGTGGPFLFGDFSIADAMFAPVVTRFRTYNVTFDGEVAAYINAILSLPAFHEWEAEAEAEPWTIEKFELPA